MTCCGQDARPAVALTNLVIPYNFAGTIIDGTDRGIGPEASVATCPTFRLSRRGEVINAERAPRADVEKPGLRVEAGSQPVGGAIRSGLDQRAVGPRSVSGFKDRPSARINA